VLLKSISAVLLLAALVVAPRVVASRAQQCVRVFNIGKTNSVGLRNTCEECKVAVINFVYSSSRHEIKKFTVPAKSQITINIDGTSSTEIIDEESCSGR
jgi:hypothetical protein